MGSNRSGRRRTQKQKRTKREQQRLARKPAQEGGTPAGGQAQATTPSAEKGS
jgi:hypothetical protein